MRTTSQRGQVYPLFGMMLVVLIGVSALSVDTGYYRYQQRVQQGATDSAAIAGAQASFYDATNSINYQNAALADAKNNGFNDGSGGVKVKVNGTYTDSGNCASGCVQVKINKPYPVFFGSIFKGFANSSGGKRDIQTIAAAKLQAVAGACLTSLGNNTISSTANGGLNGPNCGVADADCSQANGANVDVASFSTIAAGQCTGGNKEKWSGTSKAGVGQFTYSLPPADPCTQMTQCQALAAATAAQLGISSTTNKNATCTSGKTVPANPTGPLAPGCYNNPNFSSKSGYTLSAGLYVILGTMNVSCSKCTVTGTGVTLYFGTGATYTDSTGGNATVTLSAPTSGNFTGYPTYSAGEEGVLMYQTKATAWTSSLNSNANWTGLSYMPNWNVTFNGHTDNFTGNFTCNSFTFNGGVNVNIFPGKGTPTGSPSQAALAE